MPESQDSTTDKTALVPIESQPQPIAIANDPNPAAFFGAASSSAITNFAGSPYEIWRFTSVVGRGDVFGFEDQPKDGIALRWWFAHKVPMPRGDNGEVYDAIRVVLVQPDMTAFAFVSQGVADDLRSMIGAFGSKPFDPPIMIRVVKVKTNRGFSVMRIIPV